jgi:hypothetical protein
MRGYNSRIGLHSRRSVHEKDDKRGKKLPPAWQGGFPVTLMQEDRRKIAATG